MTATKTKIKYLLAATKKGLLGQGLTCPSCGSGHSRIVDRKYVVTQLRRCQRCGLLHRTPTTSEEESAWFYQSEYAQGFTTDLPDDQQLAHYLESGFANTGKDYSQYLAVLDALGAHKGDSVLDFGCSWGYGSWQLNRHGFRVESFEISRPRASYARDKLQVNVRSSLSDLQGPFDIFFSSHVLEHVPAVAKAIGFALDVLKAGGLFVAFTPNGSEQHRRTNFEVWHRLWGLVHPNFLDEVFYEKSFAKIPHLVSSKPYDLQQLAQWTASNRLPSISRLDGDELLIAARTPGAPCPHQAGDTT
jgi:2-polyprenyl-3-methyl-5-hydroxy-6-metoxy-1,4-benzoquinol methylase